MNPAQVTALLHSILVTRAEMSPSMAREGAKIYRRLPVPHQAEWGSLGLPDALLTEPAGALAKWLKELAQEEADLAKLDHDYPEGGAA